MGALMMIGMGKIVPFMSPWCQREEAMRDSTGSGGPEASGVRDGFYLLATDGSFLDANTEFAEIVGYSREELLAMRIHHVEMGRPEESISERLGAPVMGSNAFRTTTLKRKEGGTVEVQVSSHVVVLAGSRYICAVVRDLTKQKQAEELLARSLFENAPDGYCVADADGVIAEMNTTLLRWLGYRRDEVDGLMHWDDLLTAAGREISSRLLSDPVTTGQQETVDLVRKDGGPLRVLIHMAVLGVPGGQQAGFRATVRDLSREARLEAQLRQAQRLESLGALVGGIAHDFNNMLTGILGFAQLLLRSVKPSDRQYENLRRVEVLSERAASLVRQLLMFSRHDASQRISLQLNPFIKEIGTLLERIIPETIQIELNLAHRVITIETDPTQLQQVLMNLAINARDAMPRGGCLAITTSTVRLDESFCNRRAGTRPGWYALLSVSDTGVGIPEEIRARIFDPFFTTKAAEKGTGLGLAVANTIVRDHGGAMDVESAVGRGTTVRVYLPIGEKPVDRSLAPSAAVSGGSETVLLVEDDPTVLQLACAALDHFGYRLLTARDGLSALATFQTHRDQISLVVLDLVLPRLGGVETLRELRRIDPNVRVLLTTGYDSTLDVSDAPAAEIRCEILRKPYGIDELAHAVRATIDREGGAARGTG